VKKQLPSLFIIIFLLSTLGCSDNQNFRSRISPEERAAQLKERLNLTDEQTRKVEQIYRESQEKISKMRDQFEGDRSQMREKMMEQRQDINNKIEEILYEDQIGLYREYQEERQQFRRDRRQPRQ
jgi:hypothetical protein